MNWLCNIIHGDLGNSLIFRIPVIDVIKEKFFASLILMMAPGQYQEFLDFYWELLQGIKKIPGLTKQSKFTVTFYSLLQHFGLH